MNMLKLLGSTAIIISLLGDSVEGSELGYKNLGVGRARGLKVIQLKAELEKRAREGDANAKAALGSTNSAEDQIMEYDRLVSGGGSATVTGSPGHAGGALGIAEQEELRRLRAQVRQQGAAAQASAARDFKKEWQQLYQELLKAEGNEADKLSYAIAQLEKEAAAAGVPLGEQAELAEQKQKSAAAAAEDRERREAAKKAQQEQDKRAFQQVMALPHAVTGDLTLMNLLHTKLEDLNQKYIGNEVQNLHIVELLLKESNNNVLFAFRHLMGLYAEQFPPKSSQERDQIGRILGAIDRSLEERGVAPVAAQAANLKETGKEAQAYHAIQHIWGKVQRNANHDLTKYFTKATDQLTKLILNPPDQLAKTEMNNVKLREIGFNNSTLLEIRAFIHAFNLTKHPGLSAREISELERRIQFAIKDRGRQSNVQVAERQALEEHEAQDAPPPPPPGAPQQLPPPVPHQGAPVHTGPLPPPPVPGGGHQAAPPPPPAPHPAPPPPPAAQQGGAAVAPHQGNQPKVGLADLMAEIARRKAKRAQGGTNH